MNDIIWNNHFSDIPTLDDVLDSAKEDLKNCWLVSDWFDNWLETFSIKAYAVVALHYKDKWTRDFTDRFSKRTIRLLELFNQ